MSPLSLRHLSQMLQSWAYSLTTASTEPSGASGVPGASWKACQGHMGSKVAASLTVVQPQRVYSALTQPTGSRNE